jgi:phosphatidylethanolamine-binding protein (PEBP) family uncharacterized protein
MAFELKSSDFENNGFIRSKFTGQGADISPALQWHDSPAGSKSFALINDDPDVGGETKSGITKTELLKAMQEHILAQAELVGQYKR